MQWNEDLGQGAPLGVIEPLSCVVRSLMTTQRLPRTLGPKSTMPSIFEISAASFGRRASKSSATRGRPPVMSLVLDVLRGVFAMRLLSPRVSNARKPPFHPRDDLLADLPLAMHLRAGDRPMRSPTLNPLMSFDTAGRPSPRNCRLARPKGHCWAREKKLRSLCLRGPQLHQRLPFLNSPGQEWL